MDKVRSENDRAFCANNRPRRTRIDPDLRWIRFLGMRTVVAGSDRIQNKCGQCLPPVIRCGYLTHERDGGRKQCPANPLKLIEAGSESCQSLLLPQHLNMTAVCIVRRGPATDSARSPATSDDHDSRPFCTLSHSRNSYPQTRVAIL